MARIRSIKPEFFTSETMARVDLGARLTFIGLWTYVDDNGVGLDNEKLIDAALYPLDEDPLESLRRVSEDLQRLSAVGVITRYEVSGRRYLHVTNWDEHQKVSHPGKPRYPLPPPNLPKHPTSENTDPPESLPNGSGESPESVAQSSALSREQGAGSKEQGSKSFSSPPAAPDADAPPPKADGKPKKTEPYREHVERLCRRLVELMVANECKAPPITDTWRAEARRLLDLDGRDFDKAMALLEWSQRNHFWKKNIHSLPKFREQYDKLRMQANDEWERAHGANVLPFQRTPTEQGQRVSATARSIAEAHAAGEEAKRMLAAMQADGGTPFAQFGGSA